jgi:hypothetical protein
MTFILHTKATALRGACTATLIATSASAQDGAADLAQQLANPIAAIISVPFQLNFDDNLGVEDTGQRTTLNFQPVVPFGLRNGANIVTRTIVPYVWQKDVVPGTSQDGFGDVLFNAWYSETTDTGLTWGAGPIIRFPTWSDVSTETWAAGVTGIVLTVKGPWTIGGLANHLWDVEDDPATPTSSSFIQPFGAYTTPNAWTYTLTSESTYDWLAEEWSIPVNFSVSKLAPVAGVPVNWQAGVGYWATTPDAGPEGWRFRLQAQIVIPRN